MEYKSVMSPWASSPWKSWGFPISLRFLQVRTVTWAMAFVLSPNLQGRTRKALNALLTWGKKAPFSKNMLFFKVFVRLYSEKT